MSLSMQNGGRCSAIRFAIVVVAIVVGYPAHAESYSETSVQIAYAPSDKQDFVIGSGTQSGGRSTVRFEHFGTYALGQNYFNFDSYSGNNIGEGGSNRQNSFIWNTHLMYSKVTGQKLDLGPVRDFVLMGRLEDGSQDHYRAVGVGLGVMWDLPITKGAVLETTIVQRRQSFDGGGRNKPYLRLFTNIPFEVAGLNAYFSTPINIRKADKGGHDLHMEPETFVSFGPKDAYAVGIRLEHHAVSAPNQINSDGARSKTTTNVAFKWTW